MLIISTIWLMFDLSVSCVPRPCLYMLGSSSLTQVFCVCKTGLHPLYANERIYHTRSSRGASKRRTFAMVHTRGEHLSWNLVKGSSYNATVVLSKIRCIKGLTSHAIHKWHDMAIIKCSLISITKAPVWSSCHRRHTMIFIIMISINVSPSGLSCYLCYYY